MENKDVHLGVNPTLFRPDVDWGSIPTESTEKDWTLNRAMDDATYGKSEAAITLAKIIRKRNNPRYTRKVGNTWDDYVSILNGIGEIKSVNTRRYLARLHKDFSLKLIRSKRFPTEIKSYFNNIVVGRYKAFVRECK